MNAVRELLESLKVFRIKAWCGSFLDVTCMEGKRRWVGHTVARVDGITEFPVEDSSTRASAVDKLLLRIKYIVRCPGVRIVPPKRHSEFLSYHASLEETVAERLFWWSGQLSIFLLLRTKQ